MPGSSCVEASHGGYSKEMRKLSARKEAEKHQPAQSLGPFSGIIVIVSLVIEILMVSGLCSCTVAPF